MNKKYTDRQIRDMGIRHLNGTTLRTLSREYKIPYGTIKEFKKKGFMIKGYKSLCKGYGSKFFEINNQVIQVRRTKVMIGGKPWPVFVVESDWNDKSPLVLG